MKERLVSGIKPSGALHLGNYFGAVRNWVNCQESYECYFFLANYHALTEEWDAETLYTDTLEMAFDLLACGIDPNRSALFMQSDVQEHTELCWVLNGLAGFGDLLRMTSFKEHRVEAEQKGTFLSAGLFDYPVLQAADILLYRPSVVQVGADQAQHMELARRVAGRFNRRFGNFFPDPKALFGAAPRLMSLAAPARKMSKSLGSQHVITLSEPEESIWEKIKGAVTDKGPEGEVMSPGTANLFVLLKSAAPARVYEQYSSAYKEGALRYFDLKRTVFDSLIRVLHPIRERRKRIRFQEVRQALEAGSAAARRKAGETMAEVRRLTGILSLTPELLLKRSA